jgi:hypothetical protein
MPFTNVGFNVTDIYAPFRHPCVNLCRSELTKDKLLVSFTDPSFRIKPMVYPRLVDIVKPHHNDGIVVNRKQRKVFIGVALGFANEANNENTTKEVDTEVYIDTYLLEC